MARSDVYMRMNHVNPVFSQHVEGSPYMNLLYDAVQRQGGTGTVETAMSPYLEMTAANSLNVRNLRSATVDSVSAIYAQIESSAVSEASEVGAPRPPGPPRGRPSSVGGRTKALAEFRQLMQEVEKKRHFRVGLNLFNTNPDIGIDSPEHCQVPLPKPGTCQGDGRSVPGPHPERLLHEGAQRLHGGVQLHQHEGGQGPEAAADLREGAQRARED